MQTDGEYDGLNQDSSDDFDTNQDAYTDERGTWESARYGMGLLKWFKVNASLYNIMGRLMDELAPENTYDRIVPATAPSLRFYEPLVTICQ